ncbi:uncharacterized protein YybS (DUF2232 family) [Gracilibacillus halotolerans]|uniref:Uncharacterized protein YybS (DUF2232 family) n=1 Tax=Gracilibacillus halotolerans TaxID=74386 RepID=A0A841RS11_9BACI|nr:YybS family protein [Gracilibacillus halotolerans]MBB6513368.1 uncharacterized protein YybS (DUF2232 family) [Gracilibacillus halotolerans]
MRQAIDKTFIYYLIAYIGMFLLTAFIPVLHIITVFLLPIPIILWWKNWETKWVMIGITIITLLSLVIFPALPISLMAILAGCFIGYPLKKERHPYEVWANGTVGLFLSMVATYVFLELLLPFSITEEITRTIDESLEMTRQFMDSVGVGSLSPEEMLTLKEQMMALLQLIPVGMVVISMVIALVVQWLSYKWMNREAGNSYRFPPFKDFRLPKIVLWIYFIVLVLGLFGLNDPNHSMATILVNVSNLAGILLAIQGLSFIFFYNHLKKGSKALPIVAIIILLFFPFLGLYLLRILGIIDVGFDLKKRMAK